MKRWVGAWGPAAVWAAFLFLLSSRGTLPVDLSSGLDKVAHFSAYLILGALLAHAVAQLRLSPFLAVSLGFFYGFLDEWHQSMVPGRDSDYRDWIADALGTVAGVLLLLLIRRLRAPRASDGAANPAESTSR